MLREMPSSLLTVKPTLITFRMASATLCRFLLLLPRHSLCLL